MRKKISLLIIFSTISIIIVSGQCNIDTSLKIPGFYPLPSIGLFTSAVNVNANDTLQYVVPQYRLNDSVIEVQIVNIVGPLNSLWFATVPSNNNFPGGSNSCVLIGWYEPLTGVYPISIITRTKVYTTNGIFLYEDTLTGYNIEVQNITDIARPDESALSIAQNGSNIYFSLEENQRVTFEIYNLVGKKIVSQTFLPHIGTNNLNMKNYDIQSGVYLINLSDSNHRITKKVIIQ